MAAEAIELTAAGLAAAGVATFFAGAAAGMRGRQVDRRLRTFVAGATPPSSAAVAERRRPRASAPRSSALHRRLTRTALGAALQVRLARAGLAVRPVHFVTLQGATALVAALLGRSLAVAGGATALLAALFLGVLGFLAPLVVLSTMARRRLAAFEKQLPQAIESMAGTLQAGSTLPQAMEIIAQELPPPMSEEFRRVLRDMEFGLAFPDALAALHDRVPSSDLLLMTSAVGIQRRVGGDLAQLLRRISHTIRERLRIRGELRVLTAQARYSAYIVAALPVLLFFFLWNTNYEYLSGLFLPGLPRLMLGGGTVGIVIGFMAMKRVATIDI